MIEPFHSSWHFAPEASDARIPRFSKHHRRMKGPAKTRFDLQDNTPMGGDSDPPSSWIVRVYLGEDPQTEKRVYQNQTIHGPKKAAEAALTTMLLERGAGTVAEKARKIKISELLADLVADYQINGKAVEWCKLVVDKHLGPFFGHVPAGKPTTEMARSYIALRQSKGIANSTVNRELSLLRRAFNLARLSTPPRVATVPYIPMLEVRR